MSHEVANMFGSISARYDLLNDILSFGVHRRWRRRLTELLEPDPNARILDCATGTGDVAFALKKKAGQASDITGTDFSNEMLELARKKSRKYRLNVQFLYADALDLPFEDSRFDITTIAFGIRNVDDVAGCLKEMARVTKSGGRVAILEFGQAKGLFGYIYKFYSKYIMPVIGWLLSGSKHAYTYLPDTAARFACHERFVEIMNKTGCFKDCKFYALTFGIAYIYIGEVG